MTTVQVELPDVLAQSAQPEELTPEMEQMIDEQVQAVRAQRRKQAAH